MVFVRSLVKSLEPRWNIWVWTEVVLFTSGVTLLAVFGVARLDSIFQSRSAIAKFTALSSAFSTANKEKEANDNLVKIEFNLWDAHRVQSYKENLIRQFDSPLAVLEIPKIHLRVPVFDGSDDLSLNRGVGRIAGTAQPGEPGNLGIAGHRNGFFRGLKDVGVGDSIELKSLDRQDSVPSAERSSSESVTTRLNTAIIWS